jgi:hypothetical protein
VLQQRGVVVPVAFANRKTWITGIWVKVMERYVVDLFA